LAVVSVISCLVVGIGLYHELSVGSGYAPWQDRVSILIREIGFGRVLDRVENWVYTRHTPSNSAPGLHTLNVLGGASPAAVSVAKQQRVRDRQPLLQRSRHKAARRCRRTVQREHRRPHRL